MSSSSSTGLAYTDAAMITNDVPRTDCVRGLDALLSDSGLLKAVSVVNGNGNGAATNASTATAAAAAPATVIRKPVDLAGKPAQQQQQAMRMRTATPTSGSTATPPPPASLKAASASAPPSPSLAAAVAAAVAQTEAAKAAKAALMAGAAKPVAAPTTTTVITKKKSDLSGIISPVGSPDREEPPTPVAVVAAAAAAPQQKHIQIQDSDEEESDDDTTSSPPPVDISAQRAELDRAKSVLDEGKKKQQQEEVALAVSSSIIATTTADAAVAPMDVDHASYPPSTEALPTPMVEETASRQQPPQKKDSPVAQPAKSPTVAVTAPTTTKQPAASVAPKAQTAPRAQQQQQQQTAAVRPPPPSTASSLPMGSSALSHLNALAAASQAKANAAKQAKGGSGGGGGAATGSNANKNAAEKRNDHARKLAELAAEMDKRTGFGIHINGRKARSVDATAATATVDDDDDDDDDPEFEVDLEAGSDGEDHDSDEDSVSRDSEYESDDFVVKDGGEEEEESASDSDDDSDSDSDDRSSAKKRRGSRKSKKSKRSSSSSNRNKKNDKRSSSSAAKASKKSNKSRKSKGAPSSADDEGDVDVSVAALALASGNDKGILGGIGDEDDGMATDDRRDALSLPKGPSAVSDDAMKAFDAACYAYDDDADGGAALRKLCGEVKRLVRAASTPPASARATGTAMDVSDGAGGGGDEDDDDDDEETEEKTKEVLMLARWVRYAAHRVFVRSDTLERVVDMAISDESRDALNAKLESARTAHADSLASLLPVNDDVNLVLDRQRTHPHRAWPLAALLTRLLRTVALHIAEVAIEADDEQHDPMNGETPRTEFRCHVTNKVLRPGDHAYHVMFVTDARLMSDSEMGREGVDKLMREGRAEWVEPESRCKYAVEHAYVAQHATKRKSYYVDLVHDLVAFMQTERHLIVALCAWRAERKELHPRDADLRCMARFAHDDQGFTAQFVARYLILQHIVRDTILRMEKRKPTTATTTTTTTTSS